MHPILFRELETKPLTEKEKTEAGKRVIKQLLTVRQEHQAADNFLYIEQINDAINEIRAGVNYSGAQKQQLILNSIEKSQANTFEEIADDTRFSVRLIKQVVYQLVSKNILMITRSGKRSGSEFIFSKRNRLNTENHT